MTRKITKTDTKKEIESFFSNIHEKNQKEVKKIKKLSMSHNIKLGNKRKLFCKKCLIPYKNNKVMIKKGFKVIKCENCGTINRWNIKD